MGAFMSCCRLHSKRGGCKERYFRKKELFGINELPIGVFIKMFLKMNDLFLFVLRLFFCIKKWSTLLVVGAIERDGYCFIFILNVLNSIRWLKNI